MPFKRKPKPKRKPKGVVATLKELAHAFRRTDDTMTEWRRRGWIAGPPFNVVDTYVRALEGMRRDPSRNGALPPLPRDPELSALCKQAGVSRERDGENDGEPDERNVDGLPHQTVYDEFIRAGKIGYSAAIKREELHKQLLENEDQEIDNKIKAGKLMSKEEVDKRETEYDQLMMEQLIRLGEFAVSLVPPEQAEAARLKAKAFVDEIRQGVADEIRRRHPT